MTEILTTSSTGGAKGVKPERFSLIPKAPLDLLGQIYDFGTRKYAAHNYRKGYEWSKSYDALQRHLTAWWERDEFDPESGLSHLGHAAWHIFALIVFSSDDRYKQFDDRYDGYLSKDFDLNEHKILISDPKFDCEWQELMTTDRRAWECRTHKWMSVRQPALGERCGAEGVSLVPEDERPFIHPNGDKVACNYVFVRGAAFGSGDYVCKVHESSTKRHPSEGANRPCRYIDPTGNVNSGGIVIPTPGGENEH